MDNKTYESMLADVAKHFGKPHDIVVDDRFNRPQKVKLLEQWDYDMQLLLTASEENMPSADGSSSGKVAEQVKELRKAMAELGAAHDPDAAGPGKVGGSAVDKLNPAAPR
jgi:hypothetical protein